MLRTIKFIVAFIVAAVIGVVSVANSSGVEIFAWPDVTGYGLPAAPSVTIPVFIFGLLCGLVGFLLGAAREWAREGKVRSTARRARREAVQLRAKVDKLSDEKGPALTAISSR